MSKRHLVAAIDVTERILMAGICGIPIWGKKHSMASIDVTRAN